MEPIALLSTFQDNSKISYERLGVLVEITKIIVRNKHTLAFISSILVAFMVFSLASLAAFYCIVCTKEGRD